MLHARSFTFQFENLPAVQSLKLQNTSSCFSFLSVRYLRLIHHLVVLVLHCNVSRGTSVHKQTVKAWEKSVLGPSSTLVIFCTMVPDRFQSPLLSICWERVAFFFCFVTLLSLVSCVSIALVWHFDETTKTQCNVSNSKSLLMHCKLFSFFAGKCVTLFIQGRSEFLKMQAKGKKKN